jgi:hypothetical protein
LHSTLSTAAVETDPVQWIQPNRSPAGTSLADSDRSALRGRGRCCQGASPWNKEIRFGVLGREGLTGVVERQREDRWGRGRWWHEQAVACGIVWVVDELRRMEKLLSVSAWSEVDVRRPALRELVEEHDGGGSAHVSHCSR